MRGRIGRDTCSRLNRERDVAEFVIQYVPLMTIQALLLFGVVPLARRVSPNWVALWVICSLVPWVGFFTFSVLEQFPRKASRPGFPSLQ